jgi:imidazolonepropionase-like amidohydrolase
MLVLKNARMISNYKVLDRVWVAIEKGKIIRVTEEEVVAQDSDEIIDLTGKTILPGLVNSHIHFTSRRVFGTLKLNMDQTLGTMALRAARSALCCLRDGITTARDMGHKHQIELDLKVAIEKGVLVGPRIKCSGGGIVMNDGHGHLTGHQVYSQDEALAETRKQIAQGADFIKVLVSHDDLPHIDSLEPCVPWFPGEALNEMAALAHAGNIRITAHANGQQSIDLVLGAGFDCIEHGIYLNRDQARKMADSSVYLCPTMTTYKQNADEVWQRGRHWHERYKVLHAAHLESVARAVDEGVPLVTGTDMLGELVEEMELLEKAGMARMSILMAATKTGAELLEMGDQAGDIAPGKMADIIVAAQNPLDDLGCLRKLEMVIKGGKLFKPETLESLIPESSLFMDQRLS